VKAEWNGTRLWIFSFVVATWLANGPVLAKYGGGAGTADDPYQIGTAVDLLQLGESSQDHGKCFVLSADLDLDPNLPGRKRFSKAERSRVGSMSVCSQARIAAPFR
jgi:hypothetical protein